MIRRFSIMVLSILIPTVLVRADIPQVMSFQGRITDTGGQPLDTTAAMVFTIYDSGGADLWTETHTALEISSGLFDVLLGSVNPIPLEAFNHPTRYVGFGLEGEPEFAPRVQLVAAAYSYRAAAADTADYAVHGAGCGWADDGSVIRLETAADNVGIGTTSPESKLQVNGAIRLGSGSHNFEIFEALADDPAPWSAFIDYDGIAIGSSDGGNRQMFIFSDGANQYNIFTVATSQNSGSTWEADFVIEQDGDVGIGVTNPTASLEVNGMIHSHVEGFKFPDGTVQTTAATGDPGRWTLIDSVLLTNERWGIARGGAGNVLYGYPYNRGTQVNLGVACTTGANGLSWEYMTVGGGYANIATGGYATVAGGQENAATGWFSFIGGGTENAAVNSGTVAGGTGNRSGGDAFIGGGENNYAGSFTAVAGGKDNYSDGGYSAIGGGLANTTSGFCATVAGGDSCAASYNYAVVGGGYRNTANGGYGIIPGGSFCEADGEASFAAGKRAQAIHDGAFVWADSQDKDFPSTAINEFSARATGGVRFVTQVDGLGNPVAGVKVAAAGGSWSSLCDRNAKADFQDIEYREILEKLAAMPITTWRYRGQDDSVRHIGPMAQDFYAAFEVGEDDKHITAVDADGVALAAIKALHEENELLKSEIAQLRVLVNQLVDQQNK